jgi:hypothetical protein
MYLFFLIYLFIIIFQIVVTYLYKLKPNLETIQIEYNVKNEKQLRREFIYPIINKHVGLLENEDVNINDLFDYFQNNNIYKIGDFKYFVFILEKIPNSENTKTPNSEKFIYRVTPYNQLLNMESNDIIDTLNAEIINTTNSISKNTNIIMYNMSINGDTNKIKRFEYFWIDPFSKDNVIKATNFRHWKSHDNREGIVAMGLDVSDITYRKTFKYIDYIKKYVLAITSLIIFIISLQIYSSKNTYYQIKSLLFLIFSNLFLLFFINVHENVTLIKNENDKMENINSNILNVAFLSSVSLYILKTMYSDKRSSNLFIETAFCFTMSVGLLLITLYSTPKKNDIESIIANRITNQMTFDIAIFFNILIIINFILYSFFYKNN